MTSFFSPQVGIIFPLWNVAWPSPGLSAPNAPQLKCHLVFLKDKKYASDKYKDIYTELSIVKAKADCDISRLKEQLKTATEALGEKSPDNTTVSGYGQSC